MEEKYINGNDVIYFIVYKRTTGTGIDEVLQHKLFGSTETAHITLHPECAKLTRQCYTGNGVNQGRRLI